jgi:hypothetical protein
MTNNGMNACLHVGETIYHRKGVVSWVPSRAGCDGLSCSFGCKTNEVLYTALFRARAQSARCLLELFT